MFGEKRPGTQYDDTVTCGGVRVPKAHMHTGVCGSTLQQVKGRRIPYHHSKTDRKTTRFPSRKFRETLFPAFVFQYSTAPAKREERYMMRRISRIF